MTKYSLLIETDSLQELLAFLGGTRGSTKADAKEQVNSPRKARSCSQEAKTAVCVQCGDPAAYINEAGNNFCSCFCECRYKDCVPEKKGSI